MPLRYGGCGIACIGCRTGANDAANATWVQCSHGYVCLDGDPSDLSGHQVAHVCLRPECAVDAAEWLNNHLAQFGMCDACDDEPDPPVELAGASDSLARLSPPALLSPGLAKVARALAPDRGLLDNPGMGNCSFHAWFDALSRIAIAFTQPGLELVHTPLSHSDIRAACVAHARKPNVQQRVLSVAGAAISLGEFIKGTMSAWPQHVLDGRTPSAGAWCDAMSADRFWGDEAVHAVLADLFHAVCRAWWASPQGDVHAEYYSPSEGIAPTISVEVAVAGDDHCVCVLPTAPGAAGARGPTAPPSSPTDLAFPPRHAPSRPARAPPPPWGDHTPTKAAGSPPASEASTCKESPMTPTPPARPALRLPGAPPRLPASDRHVTIDAGTQRFKQRTRTMKRRLSDEAWPAAKGQHCRASQRASSPDPPGAPPLRPSPSPERDAIPTIVLDAVSVAPPPPTAPSHAPPKRARPADGLLGAHARTGGDDRGRPAGAACILDMASNDDAAASGGGQPTSGSTPQTGQTDLRGTSAEEVSGTRRPRHARPPHAPCAASGVQSYHAQRARVNRDWAKPSHVLAPLRATTQVRGSEGYHTVDAPPPTSSLGAPVAAAAERPRDVDVSVRGTPVRSTRTARAARASPSSSTHLHPYRLAHTGARGNRRGGMRRHGDRIFCPTGAGRHATDL